MRVLFLLVETETTPEFPVLAGVSVSKRRFARAVDRMRIKRQLREAYRLNNTELKAAVAKDRQLWLMFVYVGRELEPSLRVDGKVKRLLAYIRQQISEASTEKRPDQRK